MTRMDRSLTELAMAKKLQAKDEDQQLTEAVRSSAQQIWQAGLGAFAKAQEEGGRVFSRLVKDCTDLQKRTRSRTRKKSPTCARPSADWPTISAARRPVRGTSWSRCSRSASCGTEFDRCADAEGHRC